MPAVMIENIEFDDASNNYRISLRMLAELLPHVKRDSEIELCVVETRDQLDKLVKRFKPFMKLKLKVGDYWDSNKWIPTAHFSQAEAFELNFAKNYKVVVIIMELDGHILFPFELKAIGYYQPEKILENISNMESRLLLLCVKQPILNQAVSYLHDSYARLVENDIEGARTSLRKSLEVLGKFISGVISVNEADSFRNNLGKLNKNLAGFLHYGGPHIGPAPKSTTEMIIELTSVFISHLAKAIQNKAIEFEDSSNQNLS